jgi:signal transduction histidine kinase
VRADLGLIERVLTNLLDNALSHTPQNGLVEISLVPRAHVVDVTVSDTGPGIPDDLRADLFQKPISLGGARRGGGLGLRIVSRILQLHDSRIELVEVAGRGAAFRFFLPVAGDFAATEPPSAPAIGNRL